MSSGTGRPVPPLLLPWTQAVPAISRCAQLVLPTKRERKDAAVMVLAVVLTRNPDGARVAGFELELRLGRRAAA